MSKNNASQYLGGGLGGWVDWSISDLVDDCGVGLTIASAHLGVVSHAGRVALAVADLLAADVVAAAALVAPHQAVVAEAALGALVSAPKANQL